MYVCIHTYVCIFQCSWDYWILKNANQWDSNEWNIKWVIFSEMNATIQRNTYKNTEIRDEMTYEYKLENWGSYNSSNSETKSCFNIL